VSTLVRAIDISKHYCTSGATVRAISNVSLAIEQGEFVAVCGRSGSGKSTLMNLLGLLERPDYGRYSLGGLEVSDLKEDTRASIRGRQIGFVFQNPALLPRADALENVELPLMYSGVPRPERRRRAMAALDRVGLAHRSHHWPRQLSGGEQQRVVIARAIINNPSLILADEPTGALDSKTSREVLDLFDELNGGGRTIVVVTHAPDVANCAQRLISIHDGRIVQDSLRRGHNAGRHPALSDATA
jgi:putative ABC transport system ATP-binding protein